MPLLKERKLASIWIDLEIIGVVIGGGFGAKIGSYLTQILSNNISLQMVESGFLGLGDLF